MGPGSRALRALGRGHELHLRPLSRRRPGWKAEILSPLTDLPQATHNKPLFSYPRTRQPKVAEIRGPCCAVLQDSVAADGLTTGYEPRSTSPFYYTYYALRTTYYVPTIGSMLHKKPIFGCRRRAHHMPRATHHRPVPLLRTTHQIPPCTRQLPPLHIRGYLRS